MSLGRWALRSRRNLMILAVAAVCAMTVLSLSMSVLASRAQSSSATRAPAAPARAPEVSASAQPTDPSVSASAQPDDAHAGEDAHTEPSDAELVAIRGRATAFLREWLDTASEDWQGRLGPYVTDKAEQAFATTNLDAIPTSDLSAVTVTEVSGPRAEARAVLADGTTLALALEWTGLEWRVYALAQETAQ